MRYFFSAFLFLHGAIHILGFLKAFKLAHIEQLTANISYISGILWILVFSLFMASGFTYLIKVDWWYIFAFIAVLLSTFLIVTVWKDAKFGTLANVIILVTAIISYAASTFHRNYENDIKDGLRMTTIIPGSILTETDIASLPEPVRNYIRYSGSIGSPKINNFRLEFNGKIRKDEQSEWMPFTTVQYNFMEPASRHFFMKAVMMKLPVAGYHCFNHGKAFMDIRLFSLFRVQFQAGEEMDISETVTFFNDMCCMAPATLIDKRIRWLKVDGNGVNAEFTNNNIKVSAWLYFNDRGELVNFISEDRYASGKNNSMERLRWATPVKGYIEVQGHKLPAYAEAIYTYPEKEFCYGTFNLIDVKYNCKDLK